MTSIKSLLEKEGGEVMEHIKPPTPQANAEAIKEAREEVASWPSWKSNIRIERTEGKET